MLFAKFTFVSAWVIELFYFVVRKRAVAIVAASIVHFFAFHMTIGFEVRPPIIFLIVVPETRILIMRD